jgi:hypothetical protein
MDLHYYREYFKRISFIYYILLGTRVAAGVEDCPLRWKGFALVMADRKKEDIPIE